MHEALQGFAGRMQSLLIFRPLFELAQAKRYPEYDRVALGFGVLLFILNNMLMGRNECEHRDVAKFLRQIIQDNYNQFLTEDESLEMAYFFLDALRNNGRPFNYNYYDLESGAENTVKFSLIEMASYKIHGQVSFRLSNFGLDLLFKTKELYKELHLSISQLYLRQQIEKGVFREAWRTVDDMYVQVKEIHEEINGLKLRIIRNVSQVTIAEYAEIFNRVNEQFRREKEVFRSLRALLEDTFHQYQDKMRSANEDGQSAALAQTMDDLTKVSNKLDVVINEHNSLLHRQLSLSSLMEEAMLESFVNTFRTKINMEREVLDEVIGAQSSLDQVRRIIHPLLRPGAHQFFNIMKALDSQFVGEAVENALEAALEWDERELERQADLERELKRQRDARYRRYIKYCFSPLYEYDEYTLETVLGQLQPAEYAQTVDDREFLSFLIQLHQLGNIPLIVDEELAGKIVDSGSGNLPFLLTDYLKGNPELARYASLQVLGGDASLRLANDIQVTNFIFRASAKAV